MIKVKGLQCAGCGEIFPEQQATEHREDLCLMRKGEAEREAETYRRLLQEATDRAITVARERADLIRAVAANEVHDPAFHMTSTYDVVSGLYDKHVGFVRPSYQELCAIYLLMVQAVVPDFYEE